MHQIDEDAVRELSGEHQIFFMELDADRFIKGMESVMRRPVHEDVTADVDSEGGSSSDMDFDESEGDSNVAYPDEDKRCAKARCYCSGHAP